MVVDGARWGQWPLVLGERVRPAAVGNKRGKSKHGRGVKVRLRVQVVEGAFVLVVVVGIRVGVRVGIGVPQS